MTRQLLPSHTSQNEDYGSIIIDDGSATTKKVLKDTGIEPFFSGLFQRMVNDAIHPASNNINGGEDNDYYTERIQNDGSSPTCCIAKGMCGVFSVMIMLSIPVFFASPNDDDDVIGSNLDAQTLANITNQFGWDSYD